MRVLLILCCSAVLAAEKIEVFKMDKAPYNERAIITSMAVESNELIINTVDFPLGMSLPSKPDWLNGFKESALGSTVLVWAYPPSGSSERITLTKKDGGTFPEQYTYFKDKIRKKHKAKTGEVLIAILVNSFGESLKSSKTNKMIVVGQDEAAQKKIKEPFIVYNQPYGNFSFGQPIMLDFYVYNAEIGADGYTVELYIDGKKEELIKFWSPYKIKNLSKGNHEIEIVLIDPKGNRVENMPFGRQKDIISVK